MRTVREILTVKGTQVWTIERHETVLKALQKMAKNAVGALMIFEDERPIGILSERDYIRKVTLKGRSSRTTRVGEIMTSSMLMATPDWTVERFSAWCRSHSGRSWWRRTSGT